MPISAHHIHPAIVDQAAVVHEAGHVGLVAPAGPVGHIVLVEQVSADSTLSLQTG